MLLHSTLGNILGFRRCEQPNLLYNFPISESLRQNIRISNKLDWASSWRCTDPVWVKATWNEQVSYPPLKRTQL